MKLRDYQRDAVNACYQHLRTRDDNPCIVLPTGCHAAGHPIMLSDGTIVPVELIRVGDWLMGPDSKPRKVLALCHGQDDLFKVTPVKGEPFIVNGGHVLSLKSTNEGKSQFKCYRRGCEIENVTVSSWFTRSKSWKHLRKLYRVPIETPEIALPVRPYILGLILGDGCIADGTVGLASMDNEVVETWKNYAAHFGMRVSIHKSGGNCPTYRIVGTKGAANPLTTELKRLGLMGRNSGDKFVPTIYKIASRGQRLEVLAGLMDTDGSRSHGFDYISKSEKLARDVVFLARSVGLAAYIAPSRKCDQHGTCGDYWRVSISGNCEIIPTRIKRKQAEPRKQKKNPLVTGFSVEPAGRGDFYGFVLDGDHLYVDGNFVVHHNSGKTPVLAQICLDATLEWGGRVLIVSHVKELLEQAVNTLHGTDERLIPRVGVYSAGLGKKEVGYPITVAGIQSIYKKATSLGRFDMIIVDEAHLIALEGEGMYRQFLADAKLVNPNVRVIGLTATPYRMKDGMICGLDNILNHVCHETGVRDLIAQGFLCNLKSRAGSVDVDTGNLHIRGGEFIQAEIDDLMDTDALVEAACKDVWDVFQKENRKKALVFAAGVEHGNHVAALLRKLTGEPVGEIYGDTPADDRKALVKDFRNGGLRFMVNMNVLTIGFDAPNVDMIALLRPTASPGLYYQMVGRGFRIHPDKNYCRVLDYGGNVIRHGPVDTLKPNNKQTSGDGTAPVKKCEACNSLVHAAYRVCPECGTEFPKIEKTHATRASDAGILSSDVMVYDAEVTDVFYQVHTKRGAPEGTPKTLKVSYQQPGLSAELIQEWVCLEHEAGSFPQRKAALWWRSRSNTPVPTDATMAAELANDGALAKPTKIKVEYKPGERFPRIVSYELGPIPDYVPWGQKAADAADDEADREAHWQARVAEARKDGFDPPF